MMLKTLKNNSIAACIAAGAVALAGCGQNGGSDNNGGASAAPTGGADSAHSAVDAATDAVKNAANDAADSAAAAVSVDDSTALGAITTYVNSLKAGDFAKAAEVCLQEAPGTAELLKLGKSFDDMEADPQTASLGSTAKALMVDDFKGISVEQVVAEEGVVVYEVRLEEKPAVNVRVESRDGVWRVIPPTNGTPLG